MTELPLDLTSDPRLAGREYDHAGEREYRFLWWQKPPLLPVLWDGRLYLLPWGSQNRRGPLPYGPWIPQEKIDEGAFAGAVPEPVVIPAQFGHHKGTWYLISEGVRGVVIRGPDRRPVVYMLTTPSTNYYKNMTEHEAWMPMLVGQVI